MPAVARYSSATKELVIELRARGYKLGCRALEHWAERGLAPAPIRYSRGKDGFASYYPAGAAEQYAAVASVMRSGRDWRVAGLMLIGRGYLPSREATFRSLLQFLIPEDLELADDPLTRAEEEFKQFAGSPLHAKFDQIIRRNMVLARIIDPVTKKEVSIDAAVPGVMTEIIAAMLGGQLPDGAAEEIAAASGLIEPGLSVSERNERINFIEAMFAGALTFKELSSAIRTVNPEELRRAIFDLRKIMDKHPIRGAELLPEGLIDIFLVMLGLTVTVIESIGGLAWFQAMGAFV